MIVDPVGWVSSFLIWCSHLEFTADGRRTLKQTTTEQKQRTCTFSFANFHPAKHDTIRWSLCAHLDIPRLCCWPKYALSPTLQLACSDGNGCYCNTCLQKWTLFVSPIRHAWMETLGLHVVVNGWFRIAGRQVGRAVGGLGQIFNLS